jgi:hypothetical protein
MFQVFATIFFSAAVLVAFAVIGGMLLENIADIRTALGFTDAPSARVAPARLRHAGRVRSVAPRATIMPSRRAAA